MNLKSYNVLPRIKWNINLKKFLFILLGVLSFSTLLSPPYALALGIFTAQTLGNPFLLSSQKLVNWLLKIAVIGLGFGLDLTTALKAGKNGFVLTIFSISATILLGLLIGKFLGIDKKITQLISTGTAICGGSAIAAVSPIIKANAQQISISIGIVFLLNSVALFVFPLVGHILELSQTQFGLWSAIAIHDTSSVVGAASVYGDQALKIATTVKLARALWILPISLIFAFLSKGACNKIHIPYFIGFFILAILANSYIPVLQSFSPGIIYISKLFLCLVLFLIGSTLNYKSLRNIGMKPLLLAISIWIFIAIASLVIIMNEIS
ncbi:putative sulfate exporter family transporter [Gillisia sp. M10.2A]|uniref:Sulfate exporter family transporter n=1 Tax=Gillisia lutea TaxID=2909668 RepID=A0ABS9EFC7_9FLAO|nr:putative sulfate exporter family transporter [Gillisia lutea]MCF4101546.1 putative sulfate exporter family transporter [Gillisia lutea]